MELFNTPSTRSLVTVLGFLAFAWTVRLYVRYRRLVRATNSTPGRSTFFAGTPLAKVLLPEIPYIYRRSVVIWTDKYEEFRRYGQDVIANFTFCPSLQLLVHIADPKVVKEVTLNRVAFPKPVKFYKVFKFFGDSIITTEGDEWKRHHKVVARSFSERNNRLVFEETSGLVLDLFSSWDTKGQTDEVVIEDANELTRELTLMVISAAAFGQKATWEDEQIAPYGHQMSYMQEMIDTREASTEEHQDLLSNLLKARQEEKEGKAVFSDSDLMGNIFTFLFAGSETSATTLALALAFLAVHREVQERFLAEIREVVTPGHLPNYNDLSRLTYGTGIVQETLRMIPIVPALVKSPPSETKIQTVTKDVALHYNDRYWTDPYEFRPERFLSEYEKFAWVPFSAGPRACIGRRFAEIEILTTLALIVMHYEVQVLTTGANARFASETREERQARLLEVTRSMVLLETKKIPLLFRRRS